MLFIVLLLVKYAAKLQNSNYRKNMFSKKSDYHPDIYSLLSELKMLSVQRVRGFTKAHLGIIRSAFGD